MGDDLFDLESLLNPDEQHQFRQLCIPTSAAELRQLPEVVTLHLDLIRAQQGEATDVDAAEAIGASLLALLAEPGLADDLDDDARRLVRGAVEYFLFADDASGDINNPLGFDDDARVVNIVLERIGRPQHRIELA